MLFTALALLLLVLFTRHAPSNSYVVSGAMPYRQSARSVPSMFKIAASSSTVETSRDITFRTSSERQRLLEEAIGYNETAAAQLMEEANLLRSLNGTTLTLEEFWNDLLVWADDRNDHQGNGNSLPWWTKIGVLSRFSKRARRASLRRCLDLTTPYSDDDAPTNESDWYRQSKRRRSLAVLVRSLAGMVTAPTTNQDDSRPSKKQYPIIRELEKQARQSSQSAILNQQDRQNRIPPGLETPKYSVLATRNAGYEIRRYDPFSVCSVSMVQPRPVDATKTDAKISFPSVGGASAFGALAGYLFGKNQQETPMKMTTPVISSSDNRQMSFVLPSEFWKDVQAAPTPLTESGVSVEKIEGEDRAVIMLGGYTSRKIIEQRSKQLVDGLRQDSEWKVDNDAPVMIAQYNDPFTPPWKRLNEVSVKVTPR